MDSIRSKKGQTALEYLLIIVVAFIIIVSVFIFTQNTVSDVQEGPTGAAVNDLLSPRKCGNGQLDGSEECEIDTDCLSGFICSKACKCEAP